jgi:hypothetical protein
MPYRPIMLLLILVLSGCASRTTPLVIPPYPGAFNVRVTPNVPREPGPGQPYEQTLFSTTDSPATILAWYEHALYDQGWGRTEYLRQPAKLGFHSTRECPRFRDGWVKILGTVDGVTEVEIQWSEGRCRDGGYT